jgi:uncharacterized protein involved in response to NO
MTPLSGKVWDLSHFWDAPHRPLFLASFLCAFFTVAWWPLGVGIGIPAPAFEPAVLWHVHELIFGFAAAAVGGYLLTALPSWTGLPLVRGTALKVLLLFWVLSRLAIALADHVPLWLLHILNAGYFLWLAGIMCHQFLLGGTYRKSGFVGAVLVLGCAEVLFLRAAMGGHPSISLNLAHWVLIGFTLLMTVVGTRAIPALTNNWFDRIGRTDLKIQESPFSRHLALGLLAITIAGMLVGQFDVAYGALICAALAVLWAMRGWRTATALSNPLLTAQHLAFLWVPIGQATIGILWFFPTIYPLADAVHIITIGAMSGLIMAIAGRAASHHENGDMRAGKGFVLGVLMIWITTWIRLTVPLIPQHSSAILAIAAVIYCFGWAVFIVGFLPAVLGPVVRPVLSGKKHLNTNSSTLQTEKSI